MTSRTISFTLLSRNHLAMTLKKDLSAARPLPITVAIIFSAILVASLNASANAQETGSGSTDTSPTEPALEAPEKVDVNPVARDDEIEDRLTEILIATEWFKDPEVRVDDGVVFLQGETGSDEHRTWAGSLARNTQDVAAVVNRIGVIEKSPWDFSPALAELSEFRANSIQAIPFVLFGIAILVVTWLAAKLASFIAKKAFARRIPNLLLRWVATRLVVLPIFLLGIYLVLRVSGLTQLALTVLGGTGLIGLVIGIAFQDIAENFLASVLISIQKPFRIGDFVRVGEHEGVVQRVTTRGTTLMTVDGNHVQIPNSFVYKNTIENFTANPLRRVSFDVGIGYDDSATQAQEILLQTIKDHSATINDPKPRVLIDGLGASTVNLRALFWIDGSDNDLLSVRSSCMRIAKQALARAGVSMPDESREVIFPNGVPVEMVDDQSKQLHATNQTAPAKSPSTADRLTGQNSNRINGQTQKESTNDASNQPLEQDHSEAEGNMTSELHDLKRQAENSWLPGEGEELLVEDEVTGPAA